jgi:hypothetical protein
MLGVHGVGGSNPPVPTISKSQARQKKILPIHFQADSQIKLKALLVFLSPIFKGKKRNW